MLDIDFKYKESVAEELESSSLEMLMSRKSICVHCLKTLIPLNQMFHQTQFLYRSALISRNSSNFV